MSKEHIVCEGCGDRHAPEPDWTAPHNRHREVTSTEERTSFPSFNELRAEDKIDDGLRRLWMSGVTIRMRLEDVEKAARGTRGVFEKDFPPWDQRQRWGREAIMKNNRALAQWLSREPRRHRFFYLYEITPLRAMNEAGSHLNMRWLIEVVDSPEMMR